MDERDYNGAGQSLIQNHVSYSKPFMSIFRRPRYRSFVAACTFLTMASIMGLFMYTLWASHDRQPVSLGQDYSLVNITHPGSAYLDRLSHLNGPPTLRFRDNLRNDSQYITTWLSAGWTNDVMSYGNLIYLGLITERIPIVGMFTPTHVGHGNAPTLPFGEVFDVARLSNAIGLTVLEWQEVKNSQSEEVDELGCWAIWPAVQENEKDPRTSSVPDRLKLDVSYTVAPKWTKLSPLPLNDFHSSFWSLARLAYSETRDSNLAQPIASKLHNVSLPPDEQVACYDFLYYVCAQQPFEYEWDYSPAWRYVGQHMRWNQTLEKIADTYVRRAIGVAEDEITPPYISIHVRHADFETACWEAPVEECFAPLSVIARRVLEVQEELRNRRNITTNHVIVTSDEKNETWWQETKDLGWLSIDHSKTEEEYGKWYPVLIDAVIQSNGNGFVGTDRSTMSILARRRVQTWHDGAVRTFKWGKLGADDH